ncbi:MAG: hypothetical protein WCC12_15070 [Anaerolineales bacterium]
MPFAWKAKNTSDRIRSWAKLGAVLFVVLSIALYDTLNLANIGNHILINLLPVIAAAFTAVMATLVWERFERAETPRRVWRYFAVGLWSWVIAELIWGGLDIAWGEVTVSGADIFWVAGYIFFTHALFIQYRLLSSPSRRELWVRILVAVVVLGLLYSLVYHLLVTWLGAESQLVAAINSFYPVADVFLAGIAIGLVRQFGGGAFARPWLGLLAFAFTDLLYAVVEASERYAWNVNLVDVFDLAYFGAYLILGLGILSQWVFLKYGLRSPTQPQ